MTAALEALQSARKDGVFITTEGAGNISITGDPLLVSKWLPAIREHKAEILALLQPEIPAACCVCTRLEVVEIMGRPVAGCLYLAQAPYSDGWRRIPANLKNCLWSS
jgi:hypothetical protein